MRRAGTRCFKPIPGTGLEYAENTNGDFFRFNGEYYVLISGRWFKATSFVGPWTFVRRLDMPPDFAKIPEDSPKATVLASVPGTPQAKEGLIANSIPQTATITRSEAKLTVVYDGEATFVPIEGTSMTYAKNTIGPSDQGLSDNNYYCVEAGVWFKAPTPQGPWRIADTVPEEIYTIPPSSPIYYVTYVKVYNSTPDVVYVGYTPGYYGTVVSASTTTVVYGTGWYYPPYIGPTVWYGWPYTYGVGAGFTWTGTPAGASASATDTLTTPGITHGGDRWAITDTAGIRITDGEPGAGRRSPTFTACGAIPLTPAPRQPGRILIPATTALLSRGSYYNTQTGRSTVAGRGYNTNIYTGNTAGYRGAATYNPNTGIVAGGGAGYAGNIYSGQGTAGVAASPTTPTPAQALPPARTMSMPAKTARCIATTGRAATGPRTAAADGSPPPSPMPICNASSRCARRARSATRTSTRSRGSYGGGMGGGMRMGGGRRR